MKAFVFFLYCVEDLSVFPAPSFKSFSMNSTFLRYCFITLFKMIMNFDNFFKSKLNVFLIPDPHFRPPISGSPTHLRPSIPGTSSQAPPPISGLPFQALLSGPQLQILHLRLQASHLRPSSLGPPSQALFALPVSFIEAVSQAHNNRE